MIYYDRKSYEGLKNKVFWLEDLWKKMGTKEKIDYTELYKKSGEEDGRNALRRAVENLYEHTELNNKRINNLVNRYHELYNDLSKFKRYVINKEENKEK